MPRLREGFTARRRRKSNIDNGGQKDNLGDRLKVAKGAAFCPPETLTVRPARLNQKAAPLGRLHALL
jgi:hypothetical protein